MFSLTVSGGLQTRAELVPGSVGGLGNEGRVTASRQPLIELWGGAGGGAF